MKSSNDFRLVTRAGCHLCMDMEARFDMYADEKKIQYQVLDVDEDSELQARFTNDVPVLLNHDEVVCMHFFNEQEVNKAMVL